MSFRVGDILGFSGRCFTSDLVNIATWGIPRWGLSHVGIVGQYKNKLFLFESTSLDIESCAILGKKISGTQAHDLDKGISKYDGKVFHYPLTVPLNEEQCEELNKFLIDTLGVAYDTIGAIRAGGVGFSFIEGLLHKESLHSIFCSEWCAAAHKKVGILDTNNPSHFNPNHFTRFELYEDILAGHLRLK